jgi:predicted O-methyltransferase YrrM
MLQQLKRRARLWNALHAAHVVRPLTYTLPEELNLLARWAVNAETALEIGSFQGVSAAVIASAISADGILFCVDAASRDDPSRAVFNRHISRQGLAHKVRCLKGRSVDVEGELPEKLDFAFVDGDHSCEGLSADWEIVRQRLWPGGTVCLHDVLVPQAGDGCVAFFNDRIMPDPEFRLVDRAHSLAVLRRCE